MYELKPKFVHLKKICSFSVANRRMELESLSIYTTQEDAHFSRDSRYELPDSGNLLHGANFRIFRGKVGCHENKNHEILNVCMVRFTMCVAIVSAKIISTIISSMGLTSNSVKVCTSENFPLYDTRNRKVGSTWAALTAPTQTFLAPSQACTQTKLINTRRACAREISTYFVCVSRVCWLHVKSLQ